MDGIWVKTEDGTEAFLATRFWAHEKGQIHGKSDPAKPAVLEAEIGNTGGWLTMAEYRNLRAAKRQIDDIMFHYAKAERARAGLAVDDDPIWVYNIAERRVVE